MYVSPGVQVSALFCPASKKSLSVAPFSTPDLGAPFSGFKKRGRWEGSSTFLQLACSRPKMWGYDAE